jgi:hypothetical protein
LSDEGKERTREEKWRYYGDELPAGFSVGMFSWNVVRGQVAKYLLVRLSATDKAITLSAVYISQGMDSSMDYREIHGSVILEVKHICRVI